MSISYRPVRMLSVSVASLTWALAVGSPVSAEPSTDAPEPAPPTASESLGTLDEIIVTAQKRQQSIDTVGMAITALTGDQLKAQGISDVSDLTKVDPSFVVAQSSWGSPVYQIRGVSYNDFSLSASPTVSVYTDEVPYAYPDMSKGATFDLERVEVLKGPQGTLYGQNATGGAVNYIAAKPTDSFQSGIEGTYARFNAVNLNGFVSGPLTETLGARLSFNLNEGGAWQRSYTRDASLGNKDNQFARLLLTWTPMETLKVSVNLNGWVDHSQTPAAQLVGIFPSNPAYAALQPADTQAPISPQNDRAADWITGTHPANDEHYYQASLRTEFEVSPNFHLTYLGSYENYHQNDLQEPGGANYYLYLLQGGSVSSDSQELRARGSLFNNKVDWLIGGDFTRTVTNEDQNENFAGTTVAYAFEPLEARIHETPMPIIGSTNVSTDDSVSKAGFANIDYHLPQQVNLTGGLRFTQTDIRHGGCSGAVGPAGAEASTAYEAFIQSKVPTASGVIPVVPGGCATLGPNLTPYYANQVLDQNNVSWRAGADWTPIERMFLYASASKGYKAGDFPTLSATTYQAERPVVQESVMAYEIGIKSRWMENRFLLNADVFHYKYDNKQLEMRVPVPVIGLINTLLNVPHSAETGVEFTAKYLPTPNWVFTFSGTYLDSAITGTFNGYNPFSTTAINMQGEPFPSVPKWSLIGDAQYNWRINDRYTAFIAADARYQSQSQGEFGSYEALQAGYVNTPSALNPTKPPVQPGSLSTVDDSYTVADVRAGIKTRDDKWRFQIFGNNITNTYYWTNARLTGDSVVRFTGMPATYGVTVEYRY